MSESGFLNVIVDVKWSKLNIIINNLFFDDDNNKLSHSIALILSYKAVVKLLHITLSIKHLIRKLLITGALSIKINEENDTWTFLQVKMISFLTFQNFFSEEFFSFFWHIEVFVRWGSDKCHLKTTDILSRSLWKVSLSKRNWKKWFYV